MVGGEEGDAYRFEQIVEVVEVIKKGKREEESDD